MKALFRYGLCIGFLSLFSSEAFAQTAGEQVVVIQEAMFKKTRRVEFTLLGGVIPTNYFLTYVPFEGRIGFHFTEGFGIEAGGGYYPPFGSQNDYTGPIRNPIVNDLKQYPHQLGITIFEQQLFYVTLDLLWTPLHGKLHFFGTNWITAWDLSLQFGAGVTGVYDFERSGRYNQDAINPIRIRPTLNFGANVRLWLTNWMSFKFDLREYLFQKQIGQGGLSQHMSLMIGLSFLI